MLHEKPPPAVQQSATKVLLPPAVIPALSPDRSVHVLRIALHGHCQLRKAPHKCSGPESDNPPDSSMHEHFHPHVNAQNDRDLHDRPLRHEHRFPPSYLLFPSHAGVLLIPLHPNRHLPFLLPPVIAQFHRRPE